MYTTATCILGWSDRDFWAATPRKYFAVLYKYSEMKSFLQAPSAPQALVGKQAINALSELASRIR